ncbi:MAG TPA: serine/threonine-protein kinase [Burkholderiaceae bacterium]|nr:serine/threonine-protein kinase [Burkholderiaceae bacterium]
MALIDHERWLALSPLLDELLEADPDERAVRLEKIRRDDASLGEHLAQLLARQAEVETAQFLEGSVLQQHGAATLVDQVVGSYTLERMLGQGGMGSVWLARRSDGRYEGHAAVKFLNLALLGHGGLERFEREGNVLARLAHPNIARLLDAGVMAGQPYLVLEYIEGEPLDRYCDQRILPIDARVQLFLEVLAAVEHAHHNLILHRDLKPSNILVTGQGGIKLLDFGVAKLMRDGTQPSGATELTEIGGRAFTPEYAAPEQVQAADVTTATDVYALGVLLHVLLVGAHPTVREADTPVEQLRALLETEAPRASDTALHATAETAQLRATAALQLARALRGDLDNIIAKALKKSPSERYPTAAAFAADLRAYLNHEPISARPDAPVYRVRKFVRRHRLAVGAAAVTVLALVGGIVGTTWQAIEARRAQARAEASAAEAQRQKTEAEFEARVARANHEFVSQLFGDAMRGGESTRMQQRLDRARVMLRRRYQDDTDIHAILLFQLAGRYAELQDSRREAEVMQELEALAERNRKPVLQAALQCIHAFDLLHERKLDEAAPFLERGLAFAKSAAQPLDDLECVRADSMMAALRNDPAHAQQRMNEFLALLERSGRGRTRGYIAALGSLAYVQALAGELAPALVTTHRSIALEEALGSGETLGATVDFERAASLLMDLGRVSQSADADEQLARRFTDADEEVPTGMRAGIARRALVSGKPEKAVALLRQLVPFFEKEGPESHVRGAMLDLADAYWQLRRPAEAEAMLRRFDARLARRPALPHEAAEAARLRGLLALDRREIAPARKHADTLVAALDAGPGFKRAALLKGRLSASWILLKTADVEGARQQAELALTLGKAKTLDDQPSAWVAAANLLLAYAQAAGGDAASAAQNLDVARKQLDASVATEHPLRRLAALSVDGRAP